MADSLGREPSIVSVELPLDRLGELLQLEARTLFRLRRCLTWDRTCKIADHANAQAASDGVPMVSSSRSCTARHARAACAEW